MTDSDASSYCGLRARRQETITRGQLPPTLLLPKNKERVRSTTRPRLKTKGRQRSNVRQLLILQQHPMCHGAGVLSSKRNVMCSEEKELAVMHRGKRSSVCVCVSQWGCMHIFVHVFLPPRCTSTVCTNI